MIGPLVAAAAGAGYAAERALMRRERARPDASAGLDLTRPADATTVTVEADDGGRIHVTERGSGPPLVFLHGVSLSGVVFHHQVAALSDRFRVVVVDHRGHGRSEAGRDGHTLARLGADLVQVLAALDLRAALVVGHSMGGMALLQAWADHRVALVERVAGVGLLSTAAHLGFAVPGWMALSSVTTPLTVRGMRLSARLPGGHLPDNDLSYLLARLGFGPRPSPSLVDQSRRLSSAVPPTVLADLWPGIIGLDLRAVLATLTVPVEIVCGSHDRLTPRRRSEELAAGLPEARLLVLDGVGHMPMLERPAAVDAAVDRLAARVATRA